MLEILVYAYFCIHILCAYIIYTKMWFLADEETFSSGFVFAIKSVISTPTPIVEGFWVLLMPKKGLIYF